MHGFAIDPDDMAQLLASTPCTKEVAQDYLQRGFKVRVPRTSYDLMWERLEEQLGEDRAADAVCELVLATASDRVKRVIAEFYQHGHVELRVNEPRIVELLFEGDGDATQIGALLFDYQARLQKSPDAIGSSPPVEPVLSYQGPPPTHVELDQIIGDAGLSGTSSAGPGKGWRLERVRASAGTFLKADPRWAERDLEDFIVANWPKIDFGLDEPLVLVGRQVRLKGTREKVDLLARKPNGVWVAIEMKIVPANGADLTQLLSYMQDLLFAGIPHERIRGVLMAPGFAEKVLNAAGSDSRVLLLRYLSDGSSTAPRPALSRLTSPSPTQTIS